MTERADDAPPPEAPPAPRQVVATTSDGSGPLSSGFGTGKETAPTGPPRISQQFIQMSTRQYTSEIRYPSAALRGQHEGLGVLRVTIDRKGKVMDWSLKQSAGSVYLDREIERVARLVRKLDALPADYPAPTATMDIEIQFMIRR